MATNPLIAQGTLNRVRCHIVVPALTALNITASYMVKNFATISFDDAFSDQIPTGTGIVNSPAPYVLASISVGLIRTQSLALAWLNQVNATAILGDVVVHSDTAAFPSITVNNASILHIQPGPYDGMDPTVQLALRGIYYTNNDLWNAL